ncbi:MAG: glycosyltransferase, partial [Verrucomicrobia bacterium]|nr:glycosyltransferase [Verrucomicrobiota bacterium]
MKILLLAPHPFYQERGTPIAVRLLAETLAADGHHVDLLSYHEGDNVTIHPGVTHHRAPAPPGVHG